MTRETRSISFSIQSEESSEASLSLSLSLLPEWNFLSSSPSSAMYYAACMQKAYIGCRQWQKTSSFVPPSHRVETISPPYGWIAARAREILPLQVILAVTNHCHPFSAPLGKSSWKECFLSLFKPCPSAMRSETSTSTQPWKLFVPSH